MRRLLTIIGVAVFVIFVAGAAGYWFLLHTSAKPGAAIVKTAVSKPGPLEGTWSVSPGIGADDASASWIGYRVNEHLVGLTNTIVGRSRAVTGTFTVKGTSASEISVKALAAKLMTNKALRDNSVRNALDTKKYPYATFTSTVPITLPKVPKAGDLVNTSATGDFTLHGVTRHVTVPLQARWDGRRIEVIGQLPITIADYKISVPEVPGVVKAEDHGTMELQLFFEQRH